MTTYEEVSQLPDSQPAHVLSRLLIERSLNKLLLFLLQSKNTVFDCLRDEQTMNLHWSHLTNSMGTIDGLCFSVPEIALAKHKCTVKMFLPVPVRIKDNHLRCDSQVQARIACLERNQHDTITWIIGKGYDRFFSVVPIHATIISLVQNALPR
jgi:hypothetical protein